MDSQLLYGNMEPFILREDIALNYIKKKKRRKRASLLSLICSIAITVFIIIAFCVIYVDRFTITVTESTSLFLTIDETREVVTTKLEAPPLKRANDMQYSELPTNIDEGLGSKNTDTYFSYSFYLGCNESTNYSLNMTLKESSNDLEEAIRIMIIRNGVRTVYAKAKEDGSQKEIFNGSDRSTPDVVESNILLITYELSDEQNLSLSVSFNNNTYYINATSNSTIQILITTLSEDYSFYYNDTLLPNEIMTHTLST